MISKYRYELAKKIEMLNTLSSKPSPELKETLKFGNVWVFVQLVFGLRLPMKQLTKNLNIALLETSYQL